MRRGYGQYCPLALAAEILCERWTLLVISRLIDGCEYFCNIHRGVPRISPALLTQRLDRLVHAGLVTREALRKGKTRRYQLTPAGRDLGPIIGELAVWGQHWGRDMTTEDLDPGFLVWSMHMRLNTAAMPPGRTVMEFEFTSAPADCRRFWLLNEDSKVSMCLKDPGFDIDIKVVADLRRFTEAWRGIRDLRREIRNGEIRVLGAPRLVRQFPDWLLLSTLAAYPRKRVGHEASLGDNAGRWPADADLQRFMSELSHERVNE